MYNCSFTIDAEKLSAVGVPIHDSVATHPLCIECDYHVGVSSNWIMSVYVIQSGYSVLKQPHIAMKIKINVPCVHYIQAEINSTQKLNIKCKILR